VDGLSEYNIHEVSLDDLKKIAIVGTHLHKWQGSDISSIPEVFEQQAMVQLDPLNPAGRNHDTFFMSRIQNYIVDSFQKQVYPNKLTFEAYFPNIMSISSEYFPLFLPSMKKELLHKYYQTRLDKVEKLYPNIIEDTVRLLQENGPSRAADFKELSSIKPDLYFWKTSNLAGMALEMLWLLGKAIISDRDENWRKIYWLTEEYFSRDLLEDPGLSEDEINFRKFRAKQKSYPLINLGKVSITKTGSLSLGKRKRIFPEWFGKEYDKESPHILKVEEEQWGVAVPYNWKELLKDSYDSEMRAIAPLDPLIWDRELTLRIFDFDYVWEVYKIPKDRRWGYYVYPLLFEGIFIGRLEVKFDKKTKNLKFFNLQLEDDFEFNNSSETAFITLQNRWKNMVKAEKITSDKSINFTN
jgi:uncharacterized protein YcaQ